MTTAPIRPGTARRLGIHPPPPLGVTLVGYPLTDDDLSRMRGVMDGWVNRLQSAPKRRHFLWWRRRT